MRLVIATVLGLMPGALLAQDAAAPATPALPEAQSAQTQVAGMGTFGCEDVTGVENLSVLAAATDWSLGYLAGRQDAGHMPTDETVLSVTDPADVAVSIRLYCNRYPYALVIDALRDYGNRAFAAGPTAEPSLQPRLPNMRPRERPADWPPLAQTERPELVLAATDAWIPATRPAPRPEFDAVVSTRSTTN